MRGSTASGLQEFKIFSQLFRRVGGQAFFGIYKSIELLEMYLFTRAIPFSVQ